MLHQIILKIIHLFWLLVPLPLYMLYNKNYLDIKQAQLLIIQFVLLLSLMFPGWVVQIIRLVGNGLFALIVLDLCIIQYEEFIDRYQIKDNNNTAPHRRNHKYNLINGEKIFMIDRYRALKNFKFKETFIWPIFTFLWVVIKAIFTKVVQYGKGQQLFDGQIFQGFLITLDGWNCNYTQLTIIPTIWFLILLFCCLFINKILQTAKADKQIDQQNINDLNGYKIYLLQHLLIPSSIVLFIDSLYNLIAHVSCDGILECYWFFSYGILFYGISCIGVPLVILWFFYQKSGRFSLEYSQPADRNSQLSQKDNE